MKRETFVVGVLSLFDLVPRLISLDGSLYDRNRAFRPVVDFSSNSITGCIR